MELGESGQEPGGERPVDSAASGTSLRASQLKALNVNCVAFVNIGRTWVGWKQPLCHYTQVSLGAYGNRVELYTCCP